MVSLAALYAILSNSSEIDRWATQSKENKESTSQKIDLKQILPSMAREFDFEIKWCGNSF